MQKYIRKIYQSFKEYFTLIVLLVISLSFISINDKPQIKRIRTYAFSTFAYLSSVADKLASWQKDDAELEELRERNARLMLQVNKLREYGLENTELKKMLGIRDSLEHSIIACKIISKSVSKLEGNFIINRGLSDSIKIGMPVIDFNGLVGLVMDVSEDFSMVRTIKNHEFKIAVTAQRSGVNGVLTWNGSNFIIKNIPTTYDIQKGDRIVTSSFSTIIPPSIPVGLVENKEETATGILSNVIVKPFSDLTHLKNLFVVNIIQSNQINNFELNLLKSE